MIFDLSCRYDTRQSFYGKARVKEESKDNLIIYDLYSYSTNVARITINVDTNEHKFEYFGKYSQTTTRHQKEFFKQNGLSDQEIKQLFKDGSLTIKYIG